MLISKSIVLVLARYIVTGYRHLRLVYQIGKIQELKLALLLDTILSPAHSAQKRSLISQW